MPYAYFFECDDGGKVLAVTDRPSMDGELGEDIKIITVSDDAEARRVAAERAAIPLNF